MRVVIIKLLYNAVYMGESEDYNFFPGRFGFSVVVVSKGGSFRILRRERERERACE